jgi:hypothetical protein
MSPAKAQVLKKLSRLTFKIEQATLEFRKSRYAMFYRAAPAHWTKSENSVRLRPFFTLSPPPHRVGRKIEKVARS